MIRQRTIFVLTHFYPLFLALHVYFGDWCRRCQLMFNIVPIIIFGGLFTIWHETSHIRLSNTEKLFIRYLIINLVFISCYYCLCVLNCPKWVYKANTEVAGFLGITLLFYIYTYCEHK